MCTSCIELNNHSHTRKYVLRYTYSIYTSGLTYLTKLKIIFIEVKMYYLYCSGKGGLVKNNNNITPKNYLNYRFLQVFTCYLKSKIWVFVSTGWNAGTYIKVVFILSRRYIIYFHIFSTQNRRLKTLKLMLEN